jgi:hypothetical protein
MANRMTHCGNGHLRTTANTRVYNSPDGYVRLICRDCEADRSRRTHNKIKAEAEARGAW